MLDDTTLKPSWVNSDLESDLDDVWIEETDPENILGECCTGHFTVTDNEWQFSVTLEGLAVEDATGVRYFDRERAILFLGFETVCRVESVLAEEAIEEAA